MTMDSLFAVCQGHTDAWVCNGSHAVHYHEGRYDLWDTSGAFLDATNQEQSISMLAESYEVDLSKGWVLVTHV